MTLAQAAAGALVPVGEDEEGSVVRAAGQGTQEGAHANTCCMWKEGPAAPSHGRRPGSTPTNVSWCGPSSLCSWMAGRRSLPCSSPTTPPGAPPSHLSERHKLRLCGPDHPVFLPLSGPGSLQVIYRNSARTLQTAERPPGSYLNIPPSPGFGLARLSQETAPLRPQYQCLPRQVGKEKSIHEAQTTRWGEYATVHQCGDIESYKYDAAVSTTRRRSQKTARLGVTEGPRPQRDLRARD